MGRRGNRRNQGTPDDTIWQQERTLADAEADNSSSQNGGDTVCVCGSPDFALQAMLHVVNGVAKPEPLEVETLTCPECGREFEAVQAEGGRILRGDFLGYAELDD